MTSSSDFSLYHYDCYSDGERWHYQYIFHADAPLEWSPGLSRVNSVPDLLELLSGDKENVHAARCMPKWLQLEVNGG